MGLGDSIRMFFGRTAKAVGQSAAEVKVAAKDLAGDALTEVEKGAQKVASEVSKVKKATAVKPPVKPAAKKPAAKKPAAKPVAKKAPAKTAVKPAAKKTSTAASKAATKPAAKKPAAKKPAAKKPAAK